MFDLPRPVVLTEAGRTLVIYARQILAEIADGRRTVGALGQESYRGSDIRKASSDSNL